MIRQNRKILIGIAGMLVSALLISGCGRRGALQEPVTSDVVIIDEQGNTVKKPVGKSDRPFILDGLI